MSAQPSSRVAALLEKTRASHGRLAFCLDATASREGAWDLASKLTADLFEEASKVGGLSVQLCWYRGRDECSHSSWTTDAHELIEQMGRIKCKAGITQIVHMLEHIQREHQREKIGVAVLILDAVEEPPQKLYAAAAS